MACSSSGIRPARANLLKHGVDFADAVAMFDDPRALTREDFVRGEVRFATIGLDALARLLVVVLDPTRRRNSHHLRAARHSRRIQALPGLTTMQKEYDFSDAKRGPVIPPSKGKTRITIRIDDDILDWFREQVHAAGGGNYQSMINDALRSVVEERKRPLEKILRRVVREELKRAQGDR
jgi:uncharacterized protein (DUF4415 family)